jgi:hypothetical protein
VILTEQIFQGLAISLLFGLASSTALTVLVTPAIHNYAEKPMMGFCSVPNPSFFPSSLSHKAWSLL